VPFQQLVISDELHPLVEGLVASGVDQGSLQYG
jgi:hypothetical protein